LSVAADSRLLRREAELGAARLPALLVAADRVASTVAQGVHGRRRVGQGETFWQFRRYQPGDAITRVDWRQSAKTQHLYIRETEWEAAQSVWLWRDGSASMDWRSHRSLPEKGERAAVLLLALAILLNRGGEHIALLGDGAPPSGGRARIERMTQSLIKRADAPRPATDPSLPPLVDLPRHGHLVLLGDFLGPLDDIATALRRYAARGVHGHIVQILDPAEETLPFRGRTRFEGLEREGQVLVPRVETARAAYRERLAAQVDGLRGMARLMGWTFSSHRTDHRPETALLSLYMLMSGELA